MSAKTIESILDRAMSDASFAAQMLLHPRETLASYDLSSDEIQRFESLSKADFQAFSQASPDERKSFGFLRLLNHNETVLKIHRGS